MNYNQNQERLTALAKKHEDDLKEVKELDLMGETAMSQAVHISHNIQVECQCSVLTSVIIFKQDFLFYRGYQWENIEQKVEKKKKRKKKKKFQF